MLDRVLKLLHSLNFVELYKFLQAPFLRTTVTVIFKDCTCCVTKKKDLCEEGSPPLQPWRQISIIQKLASSWRMPILSCRLTSNWRWTAGGPTIKVAGQASVDWGTLLLPPPMHASLRHRSGEETPVRTAGDLSTPQLCVHGGSEHGAPCRHRCVLTTWIATFLTFWFISSASVHVLEQ